MIIIITALAIEMVTIRIYARVVLVVGSSHFRSTLVVAQHEDAFRYQEMSRRSKKSVEPLNTYGLCIRSIHTVILLNVYIYYISLFSLRPPNSFNSFDYLLGSYHYLVQRIDCVELTA